MESFLEKYFRLIIVIFLIVIIVVFKVFVGNVEIEREAPYKNPIYKLYINGELKGLDMSVKKRKTIIPDTFYSSQIVNIVINNSKFEIRYGTQINIDIIGYNCFTNLNGRDIQVGCFDYNNENMKEIGKMTFDNLMILGGSEIGLTNTLIYNGEYKENVTDLLNKKGLYQFEIQLHHNNIYSTLLFIIDLK